MNTLTRHLNPFFTDFSDALCCLDDVFQAQRDPRSTNIEDKGDVYSVSAELPGYKKDDINIEVNDGKLTLSASKEGKNEYKSVFSVKSDIDSKSISAKLEYGILTVTLPKKEVTKPRKIKIQ
ncbi:hypothetical protein CMI37_36575 [Candidatus Pacearchaeota archaeon]|nr:hypothetical protein [Candidatus Pacearchaeota archaeon]|tara:strand:+ start:1060 stop:1425 length:366 start_codon:yes stop_codon:yes gene_type:complete